MCMRMKSKLINMKVQTKGFTLVEMAIVLVVISLLVGGLLMPLSTQIENNQRTETKKALEEIKEALIGYALTNGNLPCPDTDNPPDGRVNNCNGGGGNDRNGILPWVDLGLGESDSWVTRYSYGVTRDFARTGNPFALTDTGRIRVEDGAGNRIVSDAVAVIISHGKNRMGGIDFQGNLLAASPSADEVENSDRNDRNYISRTYSMLSPTSNTQFDDIVIWISPNVLFNRMVAAQMLP